MKLDVLTTPSAFDTLREEWNTLLENSTNNLIFLSLDWQETWWSVYQPGELHIVTARSADGELVGIAPWFIRQEGTQRIIRAIGCVDVTDYLDVLVIPAQEEAFFHALAEHLAASAALFDAFNLCNIPKESVTLQKWPAILEQHGFSVSIEPQEVCPVIQLPDNWDEYVAMLDKKRRHELRRKIRRASGDQIDWYIVGPEHNLTVEIDRFLCLMAASNEEKAAFLQDEHNTRFFRAMIPRIMAQGWLQLIFLTVDGEAAAAYLNFDHNNRILVYNSGQDIVRFGAYSPGIVLLAHSIRHAIEQGRSVFDFLRGNETYKYHMGGKDTEICKLKATLAS